MDDLPVSPIFPCDTRGRHNEFICCDFPYCATHAGHKREWTNNTFERVRPLERHVGREIFRYVNESLAAQGQPIRDPADQFRSVWELFTPASTPAPQLLLIFELADAESNFGAWVTAFLAAADNWVHHAFTSTSSCTNHPYVRVFRFASRLELLQLVRMHERLQLHLHFQHISCILSSHASNQGQVFSCTPQHILAQQTREFEEFCTLRDFVVTAQQALLPALCDLHLSVCYACHMDPKTTDWPHPCEWYEEELAVVLSGSQREVYYTGSQTCDLHLVLQRALAAESSVAPRGPHADARWMAHAVRACQVELFPDLTREMGLTCYLPRDGHTGRGGDTQRSLSMRQLVMREYPDLEASASDSSAAAPETERPVHAKQTIRTHLALWLAHEALGLQSSPSPSRAADLPGAHVARALWDNLRARSDLLLSDAFLVPVPLGADEPLGRDEPGLRPEDEIGSVALAGRKHARSDAADDHKAETRDSDGPPLHGGTPDLQPFHIACRSAKAPRLAPFSPTIPPSHIFIANAEDSPGAASPEMEVENSVEAIHPLSSDHARTHACTHTLRPLLLLIFPTRAPSPHDLHVVLSRLVHSYASPPYGALLLSPPVSVSVSDDPSAAASLGNDDTPSFPVLALTVPRTAHALRQFIPAALPVLLYATHLALGENGAPVELQATAAAAVTADAGTAKSGDTLRWELGDVFREVQCVLPGLAQRARMSFVRDWKSLWASPYRDPPCVRGKTQTHTASATPVCAAAFLSPTPNAPRAAPPASLPQPRAPLLDPPFHPPLFTSTHPHPLRHPPLSLNPHGSLMVPLRGGRPKRNDCDSLRSLLPPIPDPEAPQRHHAVARHRAGRGGGQVCRYLLRSKDECPLRDRLRSHTAPQAHTTAHLHALHATDSANDLSDTPLRFKLRVPKSTRRRTRCSTHEQPRRNLESKSADACALDVNWEATDDPLQLVSAPSPACAQRRSLSPIGPSRLTLRMLRALDLTSPPLLDGPPASRLRSKNTPQQCPQCSASCASRVAEQSQVALEQAAVASSHCPRTQPAPHRETFNLPMLANVDACRVTHFDWDCYVDYEQKSMLCVLTLDVEYAQPVDHLVLDCCDLTFHSVQAIATHRESSARLDRDEVASRSRLLESCELEDWPLPEALSPESNSPPGLASLAPATKDDLKDASARDSNTRTPLATNPKAPLPRPTTPQPPSTPLSPAGTPLDYSLAPWSIRIQWPASRPPPGRVRLVYHTHPDGRSLLWTNGRHFVFTPGALINNRSCLPGQDHPRAQSTFGARVYVKEGYRVVMSGSHILCEDAHVCHEPSALPEWFPSLVPLFSDPAALRVSCFALHVPLGVHDLAFAAGPFHSQPMPSDTALSASTREPHVPIRLWAAEASTLARAQKEMGGFTIGRVLGAAIELLGPLPQGVARLDVVFLPSIFSCLGLSNPNLVFLSTSVLSSVLPSALHPYPPDAALPTFIHRGTAAHVDLHTHTHASGSESMPDKASHGAARDSILCLSRLAHEIAHFWFGIHIGIQDWREDWLSEGFATFAEDRILHQAKLARFATCQCADTRTHTPTHPRCIDLLLLRDAIKLSMLRSDIRNTEPEAQYLIPPTNILQDGSIPDALMSTRRFNQIHYLKGYFLLRLIEDILRCDLVTVLRRYIDRYPHGGLATAADFLHVVLEAARGADLPFISPARPAEAVATLKSLFHRWLRSPGLPDDNQLGARVASSRNVQEVHEAYTNWLRYDEAIRNCSTTSEDAEPHEHDDSVGPPIHPSPLGSPGHLPAKAKHITQHRRSSVHLWSATKHRKANTRSHLVRSTVGVEVPRVPSAWGTDEYLFFLLTVFHGPGPALRARTLHVMDRAFRFQQCNADVVHAWLAVNIRAHVRSTYHLIETFLRSQHAMGAFLYGELLCGSRAERCLARQVFEEIRDEMDPELRTGIQSLFGGSE